MVLHFALLDFITSCVKVITFRVVITYCVNGITSRGDYYILRQYYILRRNRRTLVGLHTLHRDDGASIRECDIILCPKIFIPWTTHQQLLANE